MELQKLLEQLTGAFGPSGCEGKVRQVIKELIAPHVDEMQVDAMGNLIAHKKGAGKKLMFVAHMDSIGMLVTHIEKEGYLRFGSLGGLSVADLCRQSVVFENGTHGVIAIPEDKEEDKDLKLSDLYIDIGAASREEALKSINLGDACVYDAPYYVQRGKCFSKYLDNRSGCAVLIAALEQLKNPKYDLWFVFSVQEEVGLRGAKPATYGVDPDIGIAVDVTLSDDLPGAAHHSSCVLGKGAGIKVMDGSVICQREVVEWMSHTAEQKKIAVQRDILQGGGTDAGAILSNRCGIYTGGICIPCRYTHAPVEVCDLGDLEAAVQLTVALTESEFDLA
jgi:endoglucanase